jgi:hypothetical protein
MNFARCILRGDAALIAADQAETIGQIDGTNRFLLRLSTTTVRIGIYDPADRVLVVLDGAAFNALFLSETYPPLARKGDHVDVRA